MKAACLTFILLFLAAIPTAMSLDNTPGASYYCINSSYLMEKIGWVDSSGACVNCLDQPLKCNYGCDQGRNVCNKWPYGALPAEHFIIIELVTLGLLMFIIYRLDVGEDDVKIFDVVAPLIALIMFLMLALQGNNVIDSTSGEDIQLVFFVWLDYGLAMFMLIPFFFSVFKFTKGVVASGE